MKDHISALATAAALIRETAEELRTSHCTPPDFDLATMDPVVRVDYDQHIRAADRLDVLRAELESAEPVAQFNDPRVQTVYQLLCSDEAPPNREEHWEGWVARRIVDALYSQPTPAQRAPQGFMECCHGVRWPHECSECQEVIDKRFAAALNARPPCVWQKVATDVWLPSCTDGELSEESMGSYCCYCGAPLQEEA